MPPDVQDSSEGLLSPPAFVWAPRPKFQDRRWLHALLLLLTVVSTTWVGMGNYASFISNYDTRPVLMALGPLLLRGFWYSGTILLILGCHELGHYFACRYYDVDASLPFFLPAPILPTGTFGAFIRIREPMPTKRIVFDIGIAGPIAGFVLAVPALFIGLWMSNVIPVPPDMQGYELGEPLLFKLASWLIWGSTPNGYSVNMHPVAFAAWFGMLATALNLLPIGQLDGGHISYALLGRRSSQVTVAMLVVMAALTLFSWNWLVWTLLIFGMLYLFGRHHPRTIDEDQPLDRGRIALAVFALLMFVLCFTPAPITELVK
jgi:membrane-associated protease RseP (regulator of RpoE activity)